jgi:hypothetical protein
LNWSDDGALKARSNDRSQSAVDRVVAMKYRGINRRMFPLSISGIRIRLKAI